MIFDHFKIDLVKNAISLLALVALVFACKQKNEKDGISPDSSVNSYPAVASTLSPAELRHYKTAANKFFDSMLGRGNFNGSVLVAKNGKIIY